MVAAGAGALLRPLGAVYGAVAARRLQSPGQSVGVPVICLGNLTVGGSGKTPAALAVGRLLLAAHQQPFFLTRGYGGRLAGPVRVDAATIQPPMSAMSHCFSRGLRRPLSRATAWRGRKPRGRRARLSS